MNRAASGAVGIGLAFVSGMANNVAYVLIDPPENAVRLAGCSVLVVRAPRMPAEPEAA